MPIEAYNPCGNGGCGCEPAYRVRCDDCGYLAKGSDTPGNAADNARGEGFQTVAGLRISDPLRWVCGLSALIRRKGTV